MKITKLGHSCLLAEMPGPINRTALFDPGTLSEVPVDSLEYLDDIFITHNHSDHLDVELIKRLAEKFPGVRVTATPEAVDQLVDEGVDASTNPPEGVKLFTSPHEVIRPFYPTDPPQEIGVHYLGKLSHPGDSHSFHETMPILALPVQAPWGTAVEAVKLALKLKPRYVIPIHDWHWSDAARSNSYDIFQKVLGEQDITFIKAVNGEPFTLDI
jgi:L-ascorbate metabolism protein UlaG (beta-lactamase superfamily)